jgi:hypothetical protein
LSRKEEQEVEMLVGIMAVEIGTTVVEALAAGEEEAEAGAVADCERPDGCQFRWRMDGVTEEKRTSKTTDRLGLVAAPLSKQSTKMTSGHPPHCKKRRSRKRPERGPRRERRQRRRRGRCCG